MTIVLAQHVVVTRKPHRCADCGRDVPPGRRMLRFVGLECIDGGFLAYYLCSLEAYKWPIERVKPDWRRNVPGRHGPKTMDGVKRCEAARNGWSR